MSELYDKLSKNIYFIGEISANHAGKLENALEIVKRAAEIGINCVKIQTYTADTITLNCDNDYFKIQGGLWDGYKLYDLYKGASTPYEWHAAIKDECDKFGIDFLSTPFDESAVDFLEKLDVKFYKIASFELTHIPLIEYAASKGKPMVISCGMGTNEEIENAINACHRQNNYEIVLLKCCSEYPAQFSDMNLKTIPDMKLRYNCPTGLSDHSMGSIGAIVGATLGATVIEKHICLSRTIKNPDSEFSMEICEYKQMIKDVKNAVEICGNVNYNRTSKEQESKNFRRSIFACKDIKKGDVFTSSNIKIVRPSAGLPPCEYKNVVGKIASKDISFGAPIDKVCFYEK